MLGSRRCVADYVRIRAARAARLYSFPCGARSVSSSQHEMEPIILLPSSPLFSNTKRPLIPHLSAFPDTRIRRYDVLYPY